MSSLPTSGQSTTIFSISENMECSNMQFQREQYPRYTSPDSISVYHAPSGYLSPPYSDSRRSTTESAFMSPVTGLGITHTHTCQMQQEQQNFYTVRPGHAEFQVDVQRNYSSPETTISPPQTVSLPSYTEGNGNLSYYIPAVHDHSPPHHSPSMLIRLARGNNWEPPHYAKHPISPATEGGPEQSHFRYRPDSMQDSKWAAASHEVVYTTSSGPSNVVAWDSDGFHQHVYQDQYAIHPSTRTSFTVHESRMTALSTPPASQEGTPVQDRDIYPPAVLRGCSRPQEVEIAQQNTMGSNTTTSGSLSTVRNRIQLQARVSKRPLGRLPKVLAAQSSLRCTQCSRTFSKQSRLRDHESSHARNGGAAVCLEPRCNKVYGRHADLARHQRSHHKGHLFPCKYCLKTFNRSDITRRHEEQSCRQHRAERASVATVRPNIRSK